MGSILSLNEPSRKAGPIQTEGVGEPRIISALKDVKDWIASKDYSANVCACPPQTAT